MLTAEEVAALDLDGVEWAVRSACDTGLGEIRAGEGVFGLRRAFRIAGARTVMTSLWPVEDHAARVWMPRLHRPPPGPPGSRQPTPCARPASRCSPSAAPEASAPTRSTGPDSSPPATGVRARRYPLTHPHLARSKIVFYG